LIFFSNSALRGDFDARYIINIFYSIGGKHHDR